MRRKVAYGLIFLCVDVVIVWHIAAHLGYELPAAVAAFALLVVADSLYEWLGKLSTSEPEAWRGEDPHDRRHNF
jgi:hypothetical protein